MNNLLFARALRMLIEDDDLFCWSIEELDYDIEFAEEWMCYPHETVEDFIACGDMGWKGSDFRDTDRWGYCGEDFETHGWHSTNDRAALWRAHFSAIDVLLATIEESEFLEEEYREVHEPSQFKLFEIINQIKEERANVLPS